MEYFTTTEIGRYFHIAPETVHKRVIQGKMPEHDKIREGVKGRPAKLWLKSNAESYKEKLINRIINLNKGHSMNRVCEICEIEESQAKKLLNDYHSVSKTGVSGYELFMQTSSKLGVN